MGIIDEYFSFYDKYISEYSKIAVFMQIGSFYECYEYFNNNEVKGNARELSQLLNIVLTKKNKNKEENDMSNPYMAGIPKSVISKYLPVLFSNDITVIIIDQDEQDCTKRFVSGIYSKTIQPVDLFGDSSDQSSDLFLTNIYIEFCDKTIVSNVINYNLTTNDMSIYKINKICIDDILTDIKRIILYYPKESNEICIYNSPLLSHNKYTKKFFQEFLDNYSIYYKEYEENLVNVNLQNQFLSKIYKNVSFGMLTPIEYLNMEFFPDVSHNLCLLLNYILNHKEKYLTNISLPYFINEDNHLILENNTINQLNIFYGKNSNKNSLYDIINFTKTHVGKRLLQERLKKPFINTEILNNLYELSSFFINNYSTYKEIFNILSELKYDFEKIHHKFQLQVLTPIDLYKLYYSYSKTFNIIQHFPVDASIHSMLSIPDKNSIINLIEFISSQFNIDDLERGVITPLLSSKFQDISKKILECKQEMEKQCNFSTVSIVYDNDSYVLTTTPSRFNKLSVSDEITILKKNTTSIKFTTPSFSHLSIELINLEQEQNVLRDSLFKNFIVSFANFSSLFPEVSSFIGSLDCIYCNTQLFFKYNYTKPIIQEATSSFFIAKGMRHPIIERISDTLYVPNDISLTNDNNGIILYAINSCGKSSLLRSVGLNIILAQSGFYVPTTEFTFYPFKNIISQVDFSDNLYSSHSSFIEEMIGLNKILKFSNESTLVLCDELTKGTEGVSAASLFASSVLHLAKLGVKFIFTTHLHEISKLTVIKNCKNLKICHLSILIEKNKIIFERILKDGPCNELYGLEIAGCVGIDKNILDTAIDIRNELVNKTNFSYKKSRYNSKKIMIECEICQYKPNKKTDIPLDCHHINFQCNADAGGFIDFFHKNNTANLVCLCKQCHQDVHNGLIIIDKYVKTTNGKELKWFKN